MEYYVARDKLYNITEQIKNYFDGEIKNDRSRINKLENGFQILNSRVDSDKTNINNKFNDLWNHVHNHNCRETSTGCNNDGGGNANYLDRHSVFCGANEYMRGWQLIRCNSSQYRVYFICCNIP